MESKKWYQSKTIWGIVVAFLGFALNTFLKVDVSVPPSADLNTIQEHLDNIKNAGGNFNTILTEVLAFAGTIFAIYGRIQADTKIK